jgi:LPS O-antigen subunit length determinant protein (WzzB/FepE family)
MHNFACRWLGAHASRADVTKAYQDTSTQALVQHMKMVQFKGAQQSRDQVKSYLSARQSFLPYAMGACSQVNIPQPDMAPDSFVKRLGLEPEPFKSWLRQQGKMEKTQWSAVAQSYFKQYACDEVADSLGDDAVADFITMQFTRATAESAAARIGDHYGHYCPWEWAEIEITGNYNRLKEGL